MTYRKVCNLAMVVSCSLGLCPVWGPGFWLLQLWKVPRGARSCSCSTRFLPRLKRGKVISFQLPKLCCTYFEGCGSVSILGSAPRKPLSSLWSFVHFPAFSTGLPSHSVSTQLGYSCLFSPRIFLEDICVCIEMN